MTSPLATVSTVDAVATALRQRVLDGSLEPGTFIREGQVSTEYGVARHTVRAATAQLAAEGLLRRTPNRGVHVPELGSDDITDIFRVRAALEAEAVRLVVDSGTATPEAAHACAALDALTPDATWSAVVEADLDFHRGVIAATRSPRLLRAYTFAQTEIELCMVQLKPHYDDPAEVAAEHRDLLAQLRGGHTDAALAAFRRHWDDAVQHLLSALTSSDGATLKEQHSND